VTITSCLISLIAFASPSPCGPKPAERWFGVTVDNVTDCNGVVDALEKFPVKPITRIVFDPGSKPSDYATAAQRIHKVSQTMGSPIDSAPPSGRLTIDAYRTRMSEFVEGLGKDIDVWEIGNEVNGDWTGESVTMGSKIQAGYEVAKAHGRPTALTLFYSDYYRGTDREMSAWAMQYLSATVRKGIDYVLISFYPATATGEHPDWKKVFASLGRVFPKAKLGFGELGLRKEDFTLSDDEVAKAQLIRRYYTMPSPDAERFIGGFFWWTFRQDAIPPSRPLWAAIRDSMKG